MQCTQSLSYRAKSCGFRITIDLLLFFCVWTLHESSLQWLSPNPSFLINMTLTFEKRSYKSEIKEVDNGFPNKFSRRRNGDIISLASQPVYWHSVNTFKKTWCNSIEIVLWWYTSAVWLPYSIYGVYRYFKSTLRNFLHDSVQQLIIWYFLIEKRHWKVIKCVICASNHLVRATGVKYHLKKLPWKNVQ